MLRANGFEFNVEIHQQELRLSAKPLGDKKRIDPVIPFSNIMGFRSGNASGYKYVHIQTWNPEGHINFDMWRTGMISGLQNRNYIIYHLWFQRKAYKLMCQELQKIVDNNKEVIAERSELHSQYMKELMAKSNYVAQPVARPQNYYGFWFDWS
jgi:hypothetical protein